MSGDFKFDFSKRKPKGKRVKPVPENLDENAKEYRERARAERKRFVDATDTEFWLCLCFPSPAEMTRWRERFGFGEEHRIYAYRDIADRLAPYKPARSSAVAFGAGVGFVGGLGFAEKTPDPLADVKYTDDLEKDCLAELSALHKALVSARSPESLSSRPIPNTGSPSHSPCATIKTLSSPSTVFASSATSIWTAWPSLGSWEASYEASPLREHQRYPLYGVWTSLFRFIRWRCIRPACECVPFRVAIERIVNR